MNRTIALGAAIVALLCCAAGQPAPSAHPAPSSQVNPAAPAVESVPSKPVELKVVSPPPAAPATDQRSVPFVIHVDKWPEHETDWTAAAVALFTLALAVVTYFLWRSTKALADEARNTSTRQLRAYVFPVQFEKLIGASTNVRVTAKNFGQTPAYKIAMTAHAELAGSEDHLTPVTDAGPSFGILAPSSVTTVLALERMAIPNTPTQAEIDSATFALYVHGLIAYTDTFGKKRWSRFRQIHDGHQFVACRSGNDADDSPDRE